MWHTAQIIFAEELVLNLSPLLHLEVICKDVVFTQPTLSRILVMLGVHELVYDRASKGSQVAKSHDSYEGRDWQCT